MIRAITMPIIPPEVFLPANAKMPLSIARTSRTIVAQNAHLFKVHIPQARTSSRMPRMKEVIPKVALDPRRTIPHIIPKIP